jgi:hypothetical protein
MTWLKDSNTHLNKSERDNSKSDKSELLAEYFAMQSSFNTDEFVEYLVEDGLDNNEIINFVREQEALANALYNFLHKAISKAWQNKPFEPADVIGEAVKLGLMIDKGEHIYGYSAQLKKQFGKDS